MWVVLYIVIIHIWHNADMDRDVIGPNSLQGSRAMETVQETNLGKETLIVRWENLTHYYISSINKQVFDIVS